MLKLLARHAGQPALPPRPRLPSRLARAERTPWARGSAKHQPRVERGGASHGAPYWQVPLVRSQTFPLAFLWSIGRRVCAFKRGRRRISLPVFVDAVKGIKRSPGFGAYPSMFTHKTHPTHAMRVQVPR